MMRWISRDGDGRGCQGGSGPRVDDAVRASLAALVFLTVAANARPADAQARAPRAGVET